MYILLDVVLAEGPHAKMCLVLSLAEKQVGRCEKRSDVARLGDSKIVIKTCFPKQLATVLLIFKVFCGVKKKVNN